MPRKLRTLIVEDSTTTRKMIMRALEQTGLAEFTFTEAEDGIDALSQYRPGEIEIIFVDMNMPRMGGLEFIRKLRSEYKKSPPTVIITAETSQERLAEAINEPGVNAFMLKPVDRDRLQTGLRKLVDSIPENTGPCVVPHGECVQQAMQTILASACDLGLTAEPDDESVRKGKIVLGMVSIQGEVHWSVALGFTQSSASAVASRFAGYEIPSDGPDLGDAIGEVTNIVAGRIKNNLGAKGLAANISLPTVIWAQGFQVLLRHNTAVDYAHFNSEVGKIWIMVAVGMDNGMML